VEESVRSTSSNHSFILIFDITAYI